MNCQLATSPTPNPRTAPPPHPARRAGDALAAHWDEVRGAREAPPTLKELGLNEVDGPGRFGFVLREVGDFEEALFVFCGEGLRNAFARDPIGKTVGELLPGDIVARFAAERAAGALDASPLDVEATAFRSVLMPVRSEFGGFGYILGSLGRRDLAA